MKSYKVTLNNQIMTKALTLDFFNKEDFQICFQNIDKTYSYALLVKFNKVEKKEYSIVIEEMEFQIYNYFYYNDNKMILTDPFIEVGTNNCDVVNHEIKNLNFHVKEVKNNENENTFIFNEPIEIELGNSLHFTNIVNGHLLHNDDLCPGVKDCKIHVAGTYIPK
jgi:hypothetical protein